MPTLDHDADEAIAKSLMRVYFAVAMQCDDFAEQIEGDPKMKNVTAPTALRIFAEGIRGGIKRHLNAAGTVATIHKNG